MNEAKKAVENLSEYGLLNTDEGFQAEIWSGIQSEIRVPAQDRPVKPVWTRYISVAATVLIVCTIGIWMVLNKNKPDNFPISYKVLKARSQEKLTEVANDTSPEMKILLPDGTEVVLQQSSKISYAINDSSPNREVYLSGEAFFNVKKDASHPFYVYTNGLITRVVGTSFRIKAMDDDSQVSVSVRTGKVLVFSDNHTGNPSDRKQDEILLEPNDKVLYDRGLKKLELTLADNPALVVAAEELQKFNFTNTPVTEIFTLLEKAYHVEIQFDAESFSNCRLTVEISQNSSLFEQLDIISEALGAAYTVEKNRVIVTGKPCM